MTTTIVCAALGALFALGCSSGSAPGTASGSSKSVAATTARAHSHFDEAVLRELGKLAVPGYELVQPAKEAVMGIVTSYYRSERENAAGVRAGAMVLVGDCMPGACLPMDKARWQEAKSSLFERQMMPKIHADNTALEWDFSEDNASGKKVVLVYVASLVKTPEPNGASGTASMHGLSLNYNDGDKQIRIGVYGQGGKSAASVDEMKALFPRSEMLAAAHELAAAFLPRF